MHMHGHEHTHGLGGGEKISRRDKLYSDVVLVTTALGMSLPLYLRLNTEIDSKWLITMPLVGLLIVAASTMAYVELLPARKNG